MLKVLSLGAGVQSTALLLMSIRGDVERFDCAIFADTGWESAAVYEHLSWLTGEAERAGIPLRRVSRGNIRADALRSTIRGRVADGGRWASMPLFVLGDGGREGMIRRQCTTEYKIVPIEREVRRLLSLKRRQRWPREVAVEMFIGISADEQRRISPDLSKRHRYPFVFDRPMRRDQIAAWLHRHYPDRIGPRSACLGCPFRSDAEWRMLRERPAEWADVVDFDRNIRRCGGLRGDAFLHRSCRPIGEVDLRDRDERAGQSLLWDQECLGMCGV